MLLQKETMRKAYEAAGETVSDEELDRIYQQMTEQWADHWLDNTVAMEKRWQQANNRQMVPALERRKILLTARQMADDEIREQWLDPLTQTIIEQEADADRYPSREEILTTPGMWRTQWVLMPSSQPETIELIDELWPEKPIRWQTIAHTYMEALQAQEKPFPSRPGDPLMASFEKEVDAVTADLNRLPEFP